MQFTYSPLDVIHMVVPLNETIGALDHILKIEVSDPESGTNILGAGKVFTTYEIQVFQPPDYKEIVQAQQLVLTELSTDEKSGKEIEGMPIKSLPNFNKESNVHEY